MPRVYNVLVYILATLLLLLSSQAYSDTFNDAVNYQHIEGQWLFKQGDSTQWSQPTFDDSNWEKIDINKTPTQKGNQSIYAWYRLNFNWNKNSNQTQLEALKILSLYIPSIRHADQTWLNGVYIGGIGTLADNWRFNQTNPQNLPRLYQLPTGLLLQGKNTLAIKVNIGFGNAWGAMYPGGSGMKTLNIGIGETEKSLKHIQKKIINITIIDTIFIILGLIDLIIIISLLRKAINPFPEFKWLLISSLLMLLGSSGHDIFFITSITDINFNQLLIIAMLGLPFVNLLYFESQYRYIPRLFLYSLSTIWLAACLLVLLPIIPEQFKIISWWIWNVIALLSFVFAFYCVIQGLRYRRTGATAQGIGLLVYVLSIRTQWLPYDFFEHRNIQIGSLFFRYALLFAYFQQIWGIRKDNIKLSQKNTSLVSKVQHTIARELHDGIGQYLATAKLKIHLLTAQQNSIDTQTITQEVDNAITGMRRIVSGLHSFMLDRHGLVKAIEIECDKLEKLYGTQISLALSGNTLSPFYQHHLFRIFQECTTNAIKHGNASSIAIALKQNALQTCFTIKDNGHGFSEQRKESQPQNEQTNFGLISLQERTQLIHGKLDTTSSKSGVTIRLTFTERLNEQ